jgi:hypothetical protein
MDFTPSAYKRLLNALLSRGFYFQTFSEYLEDPREKVIILRQDVDDRKENALGFAMIQSELGIRSTFYFRVAPQSFDKEMIRAVAAMGHEVGYHYETMEHEGGHPGKAYEEFCRNLAMFRTIVPVTTICMHGSPRSRFDNRAIWKEHDYRDLGIIGEPYFDIDFSRVAYLTDTGRMWDGERYSVRDKINKKENRISNERGNVAGYHSTFDIIRAVEAGTFPEQAMMTFHPQRWHDNVYSWSKELVLQNAKNVIKRLFFVPRDA